MKLRACLLGVAIVAALGAPRAQAGDEKIFVLKTGTKIRGELVQETKDELVVKAAGGKVSLPRAIVVQILDVPKPTPSAAPPPADEPTPVAPPAPGPSPSPSSVAAAADPDARQPLASPAELDAARADLESLATARRDAATDLPSAERRVRDTPLATLVAVIANPGSLTLDAAKIALARVRADLAPLRPLVARGIRFYAPVNRELPRDWKSLVLQVGDDPAGTLEDVLDERLSVADPLPTALLELTGAIGTLRSFPALARLLGAAEGDGIAAVRLAFLRILVRTKDSPDRALLELKGRLGALAPTDPRAEALLTLYAFGTTPEAVGVVVALLSRAEAASPGDEAESAALAELLKTGYAALMTIRTEPAVRRVLASTAIGHAPEHRIAAIRALYAFGQSPQAIRSSLDANYGSTGAAATAPDAVPSSVLAELVTMLEQAGRSKDERALIVDVLQNLTNQGFGEDVQAWRRYVGSR